VRRVVLATAGPAQTHLGALAAAGFEAVTVADYRKARTEVEGGAVAVVLCPDLPPWGGQESWPLLAMPAALRRGCVLVLLSNSFATGDALRAFVLQVDLVVAASDAPRLGELLRAALSAKQKLVALVDEEAAARLAG